MKILNAIHAQTIGGVDQVFRNYSEALIANGHEVALLISENENQNYQIDGVKKLYKLKNISQISDFCKLFFIILSFKPDVILCHSNRLMKWMKFVRFFSKAKSVAINHGITFKHSLNCQYIVSINQEISDLVVASGFKKDRSFVLPNVIKIDREFLEKTPKKPLVIGMYGRVEMRKGFDILIKAGEILAQENIDFRFKIGGFEVEKSYGFDQLKNLAKDCGIVNRCEFVGVVLDKEKFFEDVDVFCVPSREEPFGLVILEGFLYSTLVISSNTVGGKLLIGDSSKNKEMNCGLLFNNQEVADLADKIIAVYNDLSFYNKITANAFVRLKENFSFNFLVGEIDKIIKSIKNDS